MKSLKLLAITTILSLSPLANAADDSRMDFEAPKIWCANQSISTRAI
ncbi:hypothetical protein R7P66_18050 [Vibrio sp. Vb0587]|nr:hypothetical protein [Vibrio sp. Vb0587]